MIVCNEDVAGWDSSLDCWWVFESYLSNPTIEEITERTRHLLRQLFVLGEGFVCPASVETSVCCLDPAERLEPRHDWDDEEIRHLELHSSKCISRKELFDNIDKEECPSGAIPVTLHAEFDSLAVKLCIGGDDRWVDRDSEYLVGWNAFEDQQKSEAEIDVDRSCSSDPLRIELGHVAKHDGSYRHKITISTDSFLWWADTDAGRVNGDKLLDFLGGLAGLDCIIETSLFSNHDGTYDLMDGLDHDFET